TRPCPPPSPRWKPWRSRARRVDPQSHRPLRPWGHDRPRHPATRRTGFSAHAPSCADSVVPRYPSWVQGVGALRTAHPVRNITSNRFDEGRDNAVRISDVARHAGVSPSTVSYVLSGKRSISETTRRRVRRSIEALGYQPHAGARSLASRRTNVIALVVPLREDVHVPVAMRFAVSVVTAARLHDYDVLLLTQGEGPDGLRRIAAGALADGVIVMDVESDDARVPVLRSLDLPSVLIGVPEDTDDLTCV